MYHLETLEGTLDLVHRELTKAAAGGATIHVAVRAGEQELSPAADHTGQLWRTLEITGDRDITIRVRAPESTVGPTQPL